MREPKFRGLLIQEYYNHFKDNLTSRWVFGNFSLHKFHAQGGCDLSAWISDIDWQRTPDGNGDTYKEYPIMPETMGEFTGFKDASTPPKEIYEGDILQEPDHPDTYTVVWDENEGQWAVKFHGDITMPLSRLRRAYGFVAKVIGTIHDKI